MQQREWFERDKKRGREEEGEKREGGRGTSRRDRWAKWMGKIFVTEFFMSTVFIR